jgi:hypothetical protein
VPWTPVAETELANVARITARRASVEGVRGFDLEGVAKDYRGPHAYATDDPADAVLFYGHDLVLTDCPSCCFRPVKVEDGRYLVGVRAYSAAAGRRHPVGGPSLGRAVPQVR